MGDAVGAKRKAVDQLRRPQMPYHQSCQLRAIHQFGGVRVADIIADKTRFPGFAQYSSATMYRHAKLPLDGNDVIDKRTMNEGRPALLNERDCRQVKRQIQILREMEGTFTSQRIQADSVGKKVSNSTFRRVLHKLGYGYRRTRKKGLLSKNDMKARLKFARRIKRLKLGQEFWAKGISFYLDATGFEYKRNPLDQARNPSAREWRLKNEGL